MLFSSLSIGMPGMIAYAGFFEVGSPKEGNIYFFHVSLYVVVTIKYGSTKRMWKFECEKLKIV